MKLEVVMEIPKVEILGESDVFDCVSPRRVLIDGVQVPDTLQVIILAGLDALGEHYLKMVEKKMKSEHWSFK